MNAGASDGFHQIYCLTLISQRNVSFAFYQLAIAA